MSDLRIVNDALLNAANYEEFHSVKEMLALYNSHKRNAYRGDTVSHSIWLDMKEAIDSGVLTRKQKEAVGLCYVKMLPIEHAASLTGVSFHSMQDRLNGAVRNIQKALLSGELYTRKDSDFVPSFKIEGVLKGESLNGCC